MADTPRPVRWKVSATPAASRRVLAPSNPATTPPSTPQPDLFAAARQKLGTSEFYSDLSFGTIRTPETFGYRSPDKRKRPRPETDENTPLASSSSTYLADSAGSASVTTTNEPVAADADANSDLRFAAAARKKQAKKRGPRKDRAPVPDAPAAAGSGIYLGDKKAPKHIQDTRTATQKFVSARFRSITGIGSRDPWRHPTIERVNDITGEIYLTPNFEGLIFDEHNQRLIGLVARKVMNDLADEDLRPAELTSSQATWDYIVIEELAQHSFSNVRPQWRKQHNPDLAAKAELQKQFNRRRQRRVLKNDQKASVAKAFAHKFDIPVPFVTRILNETHESDEESGPEAGSGESFETWKVRMAVLAGISVASPSALSNIQFVEVLEPEWRSNDLSDLGRAMHQLWFDSLSAREQNCIKYVRVRGSGRTSRRIPDVAPWNLGISVPWLDTNRLLDENQETLHDWNTYGNPPGFNDVDFTLFSNDS
ncbi:hypothetical protein R3P38DRAFT_3516094 [Favolaschia claudopus]|uniref:Uncharacterized protein n=1 Tax=Favolaschia claudopus TaxID=2862362 RepID=A0AAW0BRE9_9AGAR